MPNQNLAMYRRIAKKEMPIIINKDSKIARRIYAGDILPRLVGRLQVKYNDTVYDVKGYLDFRNKLILHDSQQDCELIMEMEKVKPLLRRMSSMTNKEKERYQELVDGIANQTTKVWEVTKWLNYNQFDYEELIDKGLAEEI